MSTELKRISELLKKYPDRKMQTLMHYVNKDSLKLAHNKQEEKKASGIDKVTKSQYNENLEENIENLVERMKKFSYKPQPVRRTYIPKEGEDKKRPLGIPAYEDKLVQDVMSQILVEIYNPKFYEYSFGYRKGKGQHDAIKYLKGELLDKTGWVVDADIKGFFENVNHDWMMRFLEHEIEDKVFLRYIKRFLKSGIMEEGKYIETDQGTPQGGLISPVLANVYLHYVIDIWFDKKIKKKSQGFASMIRYADDTVFCFQYEGEARNFYNKFVERLREFGLEVSKEKTKIIEFGRFAKKPSTFYFLGFTVVTANSRNGKYYPKFITSEKKLKVKRVKVKQWLRENMHTPIKELIKRLNSKVKGHYNYYGVSGNSDKMKGFYEYIKLQLFKTLKRRSQRDKTNWKRFNRMLMFNPIVAPQIKVNLW